MELWTLQEAAKRTSTSLGFWRKQVLNRQIPVVKVGRLVRVRAEDVASWITARVRPAQTEPSEKERHDLHTPRPS